MNISKTNKDNFRFPLNLQFFADDPSNPEEPEEPENPDDKPDDPNPEVKTFTQEEVDKIVQGRLAKERKSWERHLEEQKTEAEKLANMSEKEKKAYQEKKRIEDLDAREAEITKRELTAQAKIQLADKGIPTELAEILNFKDAESCKKSIEIVENAFQQAVAKAVDEKIKGGKPMKKAPSSAEITLDSLKTMSPDEINKNWDDVQKLLSSNK
ncbi:MAG: DUF4355 domain-containing protein [Thomasclavelia sp.]|uniref:DUF4355 domain-containing protein n=1 Tax=Thomasclavelia sp. TaxID=3025757 RepID=UPI0039915001